MLLNKLFAKLFADVTAPDTFIAKLNCHFSEHVPSYLERRHDQKHDQRASGKCSGLANRSLKLEEYKINVLLCSKPSSNAGNASLKEAFSESALNELNVLWD
jgi:hypothetical protein